MSNITPAYDWQRFLTVNSTDTPAFGQLNQLAALPADAKGSAGSQGVHDNLLLEFFGAGDENGTFKAMVTLIEPCAGGGFNQTVSGIWTCTLSAAIGVSGSLLSASERLCDTLVVDTEFEDLEGITFQTTSPTNDRAGRLLIDRLGARYWKIYFDLGSNCTGANAQWREL